MRSTRVRRPHRIYPDIQYRGTRPDESPLPTTRTVTRDLFDIVTLVQCGVVSHVLIFEWHTAYALRGKPVRKLQAVFVMVRSACTEGAIGGRPGYPILLTCLGLLEADRRILKVL